MKESGLPIIYVNQVGGQDELIFDGNSMVLGPDGEVIASTEGAAPGVRVTVEGGRTFDAARLVIATPFVPLRSVRFTPALPTDLADAIADMAEDNPDYGLDLAGRVPDLLDVDLEQAAIDTNSSTVLVAFSRASEAREVFERDGILLAVSEYTRPTAAETAAVEWVRYRTVGDLTITGAVRSKAIDIESVIGEISAATVSERGETRADDRTSVAAMEDRKREGYF